MHFWWGLSEWEMLESSLDMIQEIENRQNPSLIQES